MVTERMFGAGKAGIELVKRLGKESAEVAVRRATEEIVKKSLGRKVVENLTEEQIRAVIKPMVDKEREDDIVLSNDEYIQALQDKYKNKIIVLYTDFELLEF
jgi:NADPH:quinone reductase-like Zn-dependent oxidoreductase